MTILSVVQDFCERTGLPSPASVLGTTDPQVKQIRALLEEEGRDLAGRGAWQGITFEASHTTLAAEDQGTIISIATNGFKYVKNQTIWDRTDQLPVMGPMDAQEWQALKAIQTQGPRYRFRIRGGKLLVNPTPTAGHSWYFEYVSENWILGADGTTYKKRFTLDTDTILIPEDLVLQGLRWRWLREKGFAYAELFNTYEAQVKDALGQDGAKPVIYMDGSQWRGPRPGIFVPDGSWSVP
jgi:hypothetical protein